MTRSRFFAILGAALLALVLAACTSFAPVYGDYSSGGVAAARFNFAPPGDRTEQLILNRLAVAFPGPATPSDPTLSVTARISSTGSPLSDVFDLPKPTTLRMEATITIAQGDVVLFEATRFTDTAYQSGKLTPVDIASRTGAEETGARSTAEALRAAILAGYRPGAISTPRR